MNLKGFFSNIVTVLKSVSVKTWIIIATSAVVAITGIIVGVGVLGNEDVSVNENPQTTTSKEEQKTPNNGEGNTSSDVVVVGVSFNKSTLALTVGNTSTLKATVTPSNATDKRLTWISSNTAVATVNNGVVTAVSTGTATITAKTTNGKTATCVVTVEKAANSYSITYHANGGTNAPATQTQNKDTTTKLSSEIPTNEGRNFMGWLCANDGELYNAGESFHSSVDVDLYALWGYTCTTCHGMGSTSQTGKCSTCSGTGIFTEIFATKVTCSTCSGGGILGACSSCKGLGGRVQCSCTCGKVWYLNDGGDRICDGCGRTVTGKRISTCGTCSGSGYANCYKCGGRGYTFQESSKKHTCHACNGSGIGTSDISCSTCKGEKVIIEYNIYRVTLKSDNSTVETTSVTINSPYTLTVPQKSGYTFMGWFDEPEGGRQYTNADGTSLSVWLEFSNKTLYAQWKKNCDVVLSKNVSSAGSVSGDGTYVEGSSVTVKATTTTTGYTFLGWYENGSKVSSNQNYTFTISKNKTLEAKWRINNYSVYVAKNISVAGSISGDGNYDHGTSVTVIATTNEGYTFLGWYENGSMVSSNVSYTFTAASNKSFEARWQINNHTVSTTQNLSAAGTVSGGGNYDYGTSITVTATTNKGYTFQGWYEDGVEVSLNASYTFVLSDGDKTLEARWKADILSISLTTNGIEGCSVRGGGNYDYGSSVTVTARDNGSCRFIGWYENDTRVSSSTDYTFTAKKDRSLVAKWGYTVTVSNENSNAGSVSETETYEVGDSATISAVASRGYDFIGWYEGDVLASSDINYTFIVSNHRDLKAKWKLLDEYVGLADFKFTMTETTCIITGVYNRSKTEYTIPYYVTGIGSEAFRGCKSMTSITIPSSVTSIGGWAFKDCNGLQSVYITDLAGWCDIDFEDGYSNPFYYANNLYLNGELTTTLVIPDGIISIRDRAFYGCSSLTSITIPGSVTSIGDYAFYDCSNLTSITIPSSVTSIGLSAFSGCTKLIQKENGISYVDKWVIDCDTRITSAILREDTVGIGPQAFRYCSSLTSITIPDSVTSIGGHAFNDCNSLQSVYITDLAGWCDIDFEDSYSHPFYYANNLYLNGELTTTLVIPDSVTRIGFATFYGFSSLTDITIPDSVTSIGGSAFKGCSSLTSITIPDSVTSISRSAFYNCSSLTSLTIPFVGATKNGTNNTNFGYIFGASSFDENARCVPTSLKTVVITGGTSIDNSAFYNCGSITSIIIPNSVTSIRGRAFDGCSSLTSITIPNSVTSISGYAFYNCSSLTSITIPNSVTSIGDYAFEGCSSLASITLSDSLTSIGDSAFSGCTKLIQKENGISYVDKWVIDCDTSITSAILREDTVGIGSHAFYGCRSLKSITIPGSVTSIGSHAFYGCRSLKSITIPDSVTSIGSHAFYGCSSLESITIPDSVTSIDTIALFYGCSSLTSITMPNSVTSISGYAFSNCSNLTSITIPDSVTSIGPGAFEGCISLTSITIPNCVTSIGADAFHGCTKLIQSENGTSYVGKWAIDCDTSITFATLRGDTVGISDSAFAECSSLTDITIPDSVTSIGFGAFERCISLTSITIPDSVTSIGYAAFRGCSSLTSITIPDSVTSIGWYAFMYCSSLTNITFDGTVEQWNAISLGNNWNSDIPATKVICSDGTVVLN